MQLTEQQFYLLLAIVPALISGILIYTLTVSLRNRIITALREELLQQQQLTANLNINLHQAETRLAVKNQNILHLQSQSQELKQQFTDLQLNREKIIQQYHLAQTSIKALQVEQQKERQHSDEKLQQLEHNREAIKKDFELLAQQVLKSTQQEFSKESRVGLDLFLQPFRQQISDFKDKVETIHTQDLKQREALKTELKHLQELNRQMTDEAHQLSSALKDQKKTQGNWGELILENVLDRSGLQAGKDYKRELSYSTEDGKRRPDVVVFLPENKHLIIDAKVSLNAYVRFVNAENDTDRNVALKEHIVAISNRIKELSNKSYFDLPGVNSPEMVFMFIPIESAFVEAVKADESLFQQAIEQQVLVTTPTTLLTSLNIVRQLWRFEDQNRYAAKLAEQASKVYNQLRLFLENMELLGVQLDKSRETYDSAMRQFVSGKGNLIKRVEDFQNLGVSVKKELPKDLLDKARLELDLIEFHQAKEVD
ncbi:MAG: DNA recombination protein RmuC [Gammaproteobacteria bacterium]|nr:DNA recombination protein RmuC [Gammaproteobacteria bacterium]